MAFFCCHFAFLDVCCVGALVKGLSQISSFFLNCLWFEQLWMKQDFIFKVCRQSRKTFLLLYCIFFIFFYYYYFISFPLSAFCDFSAIFHRIFLIFGQLIDNNLYFSCIHLWMRKSTVKVTRWHTMKMHSQPENLINATVSKWYDIV